jgi:hypothetical protein
MGFCSDKFAGNRKFLSCNEADPLQKEYNLFYISKVGSSKDYVREMESKEDDIAGLVSGTDLGSISTSMIVELDRSYARKLKSATQKSFVGILLPNPGLSSLPYIREGHLLPPWF